MFLCILRRSPGFKDDVNGSGLIWDNPVSEVLEVIQRFFDRGFCSSASQKRIWICGRSVAEKWVHLIELFVILLLYSGCHKLFSRDLCKRLISLIASLLGLAVQSRRLVVRAGVVILPELGQCCTTNVVNRSKLYFSMQLACIHILHGHVHICTLIHACILRYICACI